MDQKNYTSINAALRKNISPVSKSKESEPFPRPAESYEVKEAVEHKPEEEVKPFIQTRAETIEIPPDVKKMGVQASNTTQFPTYQNIKTPLADDKIIAGLHQPVTSSIRWLATLALYILKQAHVTLKVIHGKITRVAQT